MSAVELLQPILTGGLQRNNFFNGRLLSAEDLRAEQQANRVQQGHLARAIGDGIAWGLDVAATTASPSAARVTVERGVALNRQGDILHLTADAEVTLVPDTRVAADEAGLFAACTPAESPALPADGAYVLVIAPASGYSGTALVSDPNSTAVGRGACGARFSVEGVRFRLLPLLLADLGSLATRVTGPPALLPPATDVRLERLRNLLAHACFGTSALAADAVAPREPLDGSTPLAGWGAIDAMRLAGRITDCDVPLALVALSANGIAFVDLWSVRRRVLNAGAIDLWRTVAGPRRVAEAEAAFLQFQSQLDSVRARETGGFPAGKYFDYLPSGGWLPVGADGIDWKTFLGLHAPPEPPLPVDPGLLRGIIERSWLDDAFAFDATPSKALHVYQPEGEDFVVFARAHDGNVRLTLTPAPAAAQEVEVRAQAGSGPTVSSTTRSGNALVLVDLAPGVHRITLDAPDYETVAPFDVEVIGGLTVDLPLALTPRPNHRIVVNPVHKTTRAPITAITSITAKAGTASHAAVRGAGTAWIVSNLPAGTYALEGIAEGFQPATKSNVSAVPPGSGTTVTLEFEPLPQGPTKPDRCIRVDDVTRPPLGDVKLCLMLEATEFEEAFFFGRREAGAARRARSGEKYAVEERGKIRSDRELRYFAESGHIIYIEPAWRDWVSLEPVTLELRAWLSAWRAWLADEFDSEEVREAEPAVFVMRDYRFPSSWKDVPSAPPAYAVFGPIAIPVSIRPLNAINPVPVPIDDSRIHGLDPRLRHLLEELGILYVHELAWLWAEFLADILGGPIDPIQHLVFDALTEVTRLNEGLEFLPDVDDQVEAQLEQLGITTLIQLANADEKVLGAKIGEGYAARLIALAQRVLPADSYSLEGLGLTQPQIDELEHRGVDTKGALLETAKTDAGKALLADVLGLDAAQPQSWEAPISGLTNEAARVMTRYSVALQPETHLGLWSGVDPQTATRLTREGFRSVEELAVANPDAIAAATGIPLADATRLVNDAKGASRAGRGLAGVAALSAGELAELERMLGAGNVTLGALAQKTPDELKAAFGGDAARAAAVLSGVTSGLAGGHLP